MAKKNNMVCNITGTLSEDTIKSVTNGQLRTQLRTYMSCLSKGNASAWEIAFTAHKMIHGETYKEDFGSLAKLSEYLVTTKSKLSEKDSAIQFIIRNNVMPYKTDKHGKAKPDFSSIVPSVNACVELAKLPVVRSKDDNDNEIADSYADFCVFAGTEEPYLESVANIKKAIKEFKESLKPKAIEGEQEAGEQEAGEQEAGEQPKLTKQDALNAIIEAIIQFEITDDELHDCYMEAMLNR